jgi:hypothetical protein
MSLLVKAATAALVVTTLSSFGTDAGAAPLGASLGLRDAVAPAVQTVWWRGGYAYDYDYYCPPYATPYASTYYGYSSPYYGYSYAPSYRRYSYGPRYYGSYYYGY